MGSSMRLAAISVDLDEIPCYGAIHGLRQVPDPARWAVYQHCLPRMVAWLAERDLPATFFAVGRDAQAPQAAAALGRLRELGHEVGNHSHDHHYDLSRRDRASLQEQVELANAAIEGATGERPVGFRAPGYTVTDTVLSVVAQAGMAYDSSVFPCPSYYAAKAAAMAAIRLGRRHSRSVLDTPRMLQAPADPYAIGAPYYRAAPDGDGLLELPIGVTRWGRLPYIGTSLVLGGVHAARWLTRAIIGRPLVNLELHGIDLADVDADGLGFLRPHQPDLRRPLAAKRAALSAAVETLAAAGYRFVTLAEAAQLVAGARQGAQGSGH